MRSAFRTPDQLCVTVTRHELRSETSLEVVHNEGELTVVIFDDWWGGATATLPHELSRLIEVWERTGPLAAAVVAATWSLDRRRERLPRRR